ncbi:MAG: AbrB/MazE/SpoVT family DNA-binding domain-containing protein [Clostridia bacterium]|nr:AbrB/MazE/SpoVT family DNA-binding domain-containing protein [Clostridia bacterium]
MTQFVRKLDHMGRIVIPAEYRKNTGIELCGEVRITENNGKIIIEKLTPECKICGTEENINTEMCICDACIAKIKAL